MTLHISCDTATPTMQAAIAAGNEGMRRAMRRAERDVDGFSERARNFVLKYLKEHGPTSSEVLTDACKAAGIRPEKDRAFGAVYRELNKDSLIEFVEYCKRRKGHGTSGGSVWKVRAV